MSATNAEPENDARDKRAPIFCPFCGVRDTLEETEGSGFLEAGCYDGRTYCFEGNLPGMACSACGGTFSLDLDDDDVHEDCGCWNDRRGRFCECGRNRRKRGDPEPDAD
jgi:hypothetical protein